MFVGLSLLIGGASGAGTSYWVLQSWPQPESEWVEVTAPSSTGDVFSLVDAQQKVAPAVISIVEYIDLEELRQQFLGSGRPFGSFSMLQLDPDFDGRTEVGGGTGFLIDPSGIALTNKHVISDTQGQYVAILQDGTEFEIFIEATDPGNDVAIIRLVAEEGSAEAEFLGELPYATLGESSLLQVGEPVLAIGNALAEYENTTTAGIISATGRKIVASDSSGRAESLYGLIQTDAAINPGNSGGPLVNVNGEVVGVNTAVDTEAQGIGFALPIDDVKPAIESWQTFGEIRRPMLGVRYVMLTAPRARELGFDVDHGALIVGDPETGEAAVVEGSPAEAAGLEAMDIVLAIDGEEVTLDYTLQDAVLRHQVGDLIVLTVWRNGDTFEVEVELTAVPASD